jgi:hypothetical protein
MQIFKHNKTPIQSINQSINQSIKQMSCWSTSKGDEAVDSKSPRTIRRQNRDAKRYDSDPESERRKNLVRAWKKRTEVEIEYLSVWQRFDTLNRSVNKHESDIGMWYCLVMLFLVPIIILIANVHFIAYETQSQAKYLSFRAEELENRTNQLVDQYAYFTQQILEKTTVDDDDEPEQQQMYRDSTGHEWDQRIEVKRIESNHQAGGISSSSGRNNKFTTQWDPSDPLLPGMQFPSCIVYCKQLSCSCPLGPQGNPGIDGTTAIYGSIYSVVNTSLTLVNGLNTIDAGGVITIYNKALGQYILNQDGYFGNLTLASNVTLFTNGFKLFIADTLALFNGSLITAQGGDANGITAGTTLISASATLGGGSAGGAGANGYANGGAGAAVTYAMVGSGGAGGAAGGITTAGAAGTVTYIPTSEGGQFAMHSVLGFAMGVSAITSNLFNTGSGGGGGAGSSFTSKGGGGGASGGIVLIAARHIVLPGAQLGYYLIPYIPTTASISVRGGNGASGTVTNAGGGGGGSGGFVALYTTTDATSLFNLGFTINVAGGHGGAGIGTGAGGQAGASGHYIIPQ